jgi:single stranded DNA-binding protein
MVNKVWLIGRIATEPELKYTSDGVAVISFRLAVGRNLPNSEGEKETDFLNIIGWRKTAEFVANYLNIGRLVSVEGRIHPATGSARTKSSAPPPRSTSTTSVPWIEPRAAPLTTWRTGW